MSIENPIVPSSAPLSDPEVVVQILEDGVALVRLNRPEAANALK